MQYQTSAPSEGAGAVEGGAEAAEQGGAAELDVPQVRAGGADADHGGLVGPVPVSRFEPGRIEPVQEAGRVRGWAAGGGQGEVDDGLHDVGVVGGGPVPGLDHLQQQDTEVAGRQVPQAEPGLVRPDRDPAGADPVQEAAGPFGFDAGVGAAFAVQHDQQRPVPLPRG